MPTFKLLSADVFLKRNEKLQTVGNNRWQMPPGSRQTDWLGHKKISLFHPQHYLPKRNKEISFV